MTQFSTSHSSRRVSASAVAAMLASDGWTPRIERARTCKRAAAVRKITKSDERLEALPAGHPVSWGALWGGDRVPVFPGLKPIGSSERFVEVN